MIHYPQESALGNTFLMSTPDGDAGRQVWCRLVINGADTTVESLGSPPNLQDHAMDFFIGRDETYIVIVLKPNHQRMCGGYADLFISFQGKDHRWTEPRNLGPAINIPDPADGRWGPYVSPDNRYLFYSHGKDASTAGINWVRFDTLLEKMR